ncbi:MAG: cyclic nucleotide-binding domain-containing protein, partial [Thermoflexales bacterium]|nr:cyclic nucleotide-binding domain-containing protein [Thermoflexales bacterium]
PAFFVDTMDIWMEPKLRRIAVTWAGPYSSLIVGGICGLMAWLLPGGLLAHLAFKAAFLCYLGALVNLNPLLELDGYFILIDWLGMPNLRERSFAFIRSELWTKLKSAFASSTSLPGITPKSPPLFNREETIFTAFGALAAGYTLYTLVVAAYFWQTRFSRLLVELWQRPDWPSKLAAVVFGVGVIVPAALVAGISAWSLGRGLVSQLEKRRFFESERNVSGVLAASLALLVLAPAFMGTLSWKWYAGVTPVLLLSLAVGALIKVAQQHAGSRIQATFWALAFSALLAAGGALVRAGAMYLSRATHLGGASHASVMLGLEQLAALPLLVAGFQSMLEVDLRHSRRHERLAIIALLALGFVTVIPAARWTVGQSLPVVVLAAGGPYLTLVYLATIIPTLLTYTGTRFLLPWLALVAAAGLNGALCLARLWPAWPLMQDGDLWLSLLVAGLWALGSAGYLLAGLRLRPAPSHWSEDLLLSDQERLRLAFARFFATLFDTFRATYGARRAKALDDDMDVIAVAADWDVEVNSGRINDELDLAKITIVEQADRYRDVLGRTIDLMDNWGGTAFVERATQAAYDSLPWPERETLGQYVLAGSPWGGTIAGKFDAVRSQRYHLLQQVPLLSSCNNRSLALILAAIKSEHLPAGVLLGQQGSRVTRFVIVQSGAVEKWIKPGEAKTSPQLAGVMRRGASLGSEAFMGGGAYTGTYRTAVATDILFLTMAECEQLRRAGLKLATEVGQLLAIRQLLGRMPLFASMGPQQLDGLTHQAGQREAKAGELIIRQGEERHHFYIIASGQVQISVTDPEGQERIVAQLGPGEHFGESALYADIPYSATCRAIAPTTLLTLDEHAFDTMVGSSMHMTHYVEQVSSGRVIDTRRKLSLAGVMG